ncbi:MAG: hypothetical protein RBG1_1C00001G1089 [candidate division Zixibacteria bacterium RBG-1]|nr:MAG: hypothetical protein RBG1_1C00001G1089 [candidate division Zixibacteria bacterium RBG-1]OGC83203.1 MAG: hypothetical protein A2V73_06805 [candidate division Zixibacteria bacterium RBG_19FT_COMBO_42_43]
MSEKFKILVVDDEKSVLDLISSMLSEEPFSLEVASNAAQAFRILESQSLNMVITDLMIGKESGVDVLKKAKELQPNIVAILMTGQPSIENVVTVLKLGAFDYVVKPFTEEILKATIYSGLQKQKLFRENIHLKEQLSLYKISTAMGSTSDVSQILDMVLTTALREFEADTASILLLDEKSGKLILKASRGIPDYNITKSLWDLEDKLSTMVINEAQPKIFNQKNLKGPDKKINSFISHPLLAKGKVIGVLNLIRSEKLNPFSSGQMQTMGIIASKASTILENTKLYEELENTYLSVITTLANAIEARDFYTAGHTERVSRWAVTLAKKLNWPELKIKEVRMGSILHDIGKIGIPDHILNKPASLTKQEFEIMKTHPEIGVRILQGITFLTPALPYVLYHHERYDGKGYPKGLLGENVPLEGRLMSIVDTFDAITSDRPYRKNLGYDKAVQEIKDNTGKQFDAEMAKAFLEAWKAGEIEQSPSAFEKTQRIFAGMTESPIGSTSLK